MDVIRQLEPDLFRKVTGLTLKEFDLLVSLGVFNRDLMNDAVYKFKRYEDSSLEYTGINTHNGTVIGGWDTVKDIAQETEPEEEPEPIIEEEVQEVVQEYRRTEVVEPTKESVESNVEPASGEKDRKEWKDIVVGDKVNHKSLGVGKVVSLDENYIVVKYPLFEKKFVYPMVFEKGYMSYCPQKKTMGAKQTVQQSESPLTVEEIKRIDKEVKTLLANVKLDDSSEKTSLSGAFSKLKSKKFWRNRAAAAFNKVGIESRDQLTLSRLKELIPKNVQVDKETGQKIIGVWEEKRQKDAYGNYILNEDGTYHTKPHFKVCRTWSLELLIKILAENGIVM